MEQILENTNDIVASIKKRLENQKIQRVFLVRGHHSYERCGAAELLCPIWKDLQLTEYADFSVNPKDEEAQRGVQLLLEAMSDVIIAVGGGSVMDMAKLIRHYATEKGEFVPLWAIPTTAGTGAEATHFAVVYREGIKHSIEADDILPDVAILYPPFTYHNGTYLTACTGFDALAQAIEAFWNPNATDESDDYSLLAIGLIHRQLAECLKQPEDTELRAQLMQGAYWAGRAINITKTTAPHAFSYAFTTHCGYPHGHAVAITFPFFARLNMSNSVKKDALYKALGLFPHVDMQEYFTNYLNRIGMKYKGTKGVDLQWLLSQVNMDRMKNNPVPITLIIKNELHLFITNIPYD